MVARLKFVIDKEGEIQVSVEGASGNECEKMSAPFEEALGMVASREYKDSYYAETTTEQSQEGAAS